MIMAGGVCRYVVVVFLNMEPLAIHWFKIKWFLIVWWFLWEVCNQFETYSRKLSFPNSNMFQTSSSKPPRWIWKSTSLVSTLPPLEKVETQSGTALQPEAIPQWKGKSSEANLHYFWFPCHVPFAVWLCAGVRSVKFCTVIKCARSGGSSMIFFSNKKVNREETRNTPQNWW